MPAKPHKTIDDDLAAAIGALAKRVARRTKSGHVITGRLKRPLGNKIFIAVADDDTLTLHAIKRSIGGGRRRQTQSRDIATRLAEIEAVLEEFEPRARAPLTDAEAEVLAEGGAKVPGDSTALADDARVRAAAAYSRLLRDSYSTAQAAKQLRVNTSRVRQRLSGTPPTLYGIRVGKEWRIPRFQFDRDHVIPGLEAVLGALSRDVHPVALHEWFTLRHGDLCDESGAECYSPIEWLRSGRPASTVAQLAAEL